MIKTTLRVRRFHHGERTKCALSECGNDRNRQHIDPLGRFGGWHYHQQPRVYFDVVIQVSNDPNFAEDTKTLFNNDMDNSAGLGTGEAMHYVDTHFGELFDARALHGRYVRLYSRGNTANDLNHYIEVEVYGKPVE